MFSIRPSLHASVVAIVACLYSLLSAADLTLTGEPLKEATIELEARGYDTSVETLTSLFSDTSKDIRIRQLSAISLGESDFPDAVNILLVWINDSDPRLRDAAIRGLAFDPDSRVIEGLSQIVQGNHEPTTKQLALSALFKLEDRQVRNLLDETARNVSQSTAVRISIIEHFRRHPEIDADDLMRELSVARDPELRARAALARSDRFSSEKKAALYQGAMDDDLPHHVWIDVVSELERIRGRPFNSNTDIRDIGVNKDMREDTIDEIESWWAQGGRLE